MFHLNEKFKKPLSPAGWRNKVSAFLNNLVSGDGIIKITKPEDPTPSNPPTVSIDLEALATKVAPYIDDTYPFKLRKYYDGSNTYLQIWLGSSASGHIRINNTEWTIDTSTVSQVTDEKLANTGWWTLTNSLFKNWTVSRSVWMRQKTDSSGNPINTVTFTNTALSSNPKNLLEVCLGYATAYDSASGCIIYQNTVGAINLLEGAGANQSSATSIPMQRAASWSPSATTLWDRTSTDTSASYYNKNLSLSVVTSFQLCPTSLSETLRTYCVRLHFVTLVFDSKGGLVSAKISSTSQFYDVLDNAYYGDL